MNGSGTATQSSAFVHQNGQIVLQFHEETLGSMQVGDLEATNLSNRYLWGPVVDQLFADEQVEDLFTTVDNETLWALTDHLGSVRDAVDSDGNLRLHRQFDAFGKILDETHYDANGQEIEPGWFGYATLAFAYTGRPFDEATGLQNNWNRWYDPAIGRWMSEDPIGFAAGDANLSRYVRNEPTRFVDPDGLAEEEPINAITPEVPIISQPIENLPIRIQLALRDPSRYAVGLHQDQGYFILDKQTGAVHFVGDESALPLREQARRARTAAECAEQEDMLLGAAGNLMTSIPGVETFRDGYEVITGRDLVDPNVRLSNRDRIGTAQMFFVPGLSGSQVRKTDELLEAVQEARGITIRGPRLGQEQGREFRVDQLEIYEFDPNCPAHVRGWLSNERRRIARGGTPMEPAVPPGYELGHGRATPAREGYDYSNSQLQGIDLNRLEERIRRQLGRP